MVRETRSRARKSGTDTPGTPVTEVSNLFSAQASVRSSTRTSPTTTTSDMMDEDDVLPTPKTVLGKRTRALRVSVEIPTLEALSRVSGTVDTHDDGHSVSP
jgi:hypothetical protein